MKFSFMTLGTASALPTANRYPSAHILTVRERLFLIDCGEGAQMQMRKAGISIGRIDNVFISHLHGDHIFGLFGLLSTFAMMGRTAPLYIYAPDRMAEILNFFRTQFGEGIKYDIILESIKSKEPVKILDMNTLEVFAFPLKHRGETYGFLFKEKKPLRNVKKHLIEPYKLTLYEIARLKEGEDVVRNSVPDHAWTYLEASVTNEVGDVVAEEGTKATMEGIEDTTENATEKITEEMTHTEVLKSLDFTYLPYEPRTFAYCSDTAPFAKLPGWVKGVDLLYHEGTFGEELKETAKATFHSTAADAARCAKQAGAGKLVIGHYSSRYKNLEALLQEAQNIFPNTFLAKEGAIFDIPLEKHS